MSAPAWMPLYVSEYLADTGHLSTVEHGAYMLLIMHYWQNGGLPPDEGKLARICRLGPREWAASRDTIADLFSEDWSHKRIDHELATAVDVIDKKRAAGRAGGLASAERRKQHPRGKRPTTVQATVEAIGNDRSTAATANVNTLPIPSTPSHEEGTSDRNTTVAVVPLVRRPSDDELTIPDFLRRA